MMIIISHIITYKCIYSYVYDAVENVIIIFIFFFCIYTIVKVGVEFEHEYS